MNIAEKFRLTADFTRSLGAIELRKTQSPKLRAHALIEHIGPHLDWPGPKYYRRNWALNNLRC